MQGNSKTKEAFAATFPWTPANGLSRLHGMA